MGDSYSDLDGSENGPKLSLWRSSVCLRSTTIGILLPFRRIQSAGGGELSNVIVETLWQIYLSFLNRENEMK